jgi:CTP:molybdopterin cytidylyltransferase MocA
MEAPPVAAIVLAAGASSRMGSPKATLRWRGRAFVDHCVDLTDACTVTVVVDGATPLHAHRFDHAIVLEHHSQWSDGPLSSLQCGLRRALASAPDLCGVLVLTVDRPHVKATTIATLLATHAASPHAFIQPAYGGASGHPVVWPRVALKSLLALPPTESPRTLLAAKSAPARLRVTVDDPAVLDNIDRPEAYQALLQRDPEAPADL